jgi:hypothetical protein
MVLLRNNPQKILRPHKIWNRHKANKFAGVAELADAQDLGSCGKMRMSEKASNDAAYSPLFKDNKITFA